MMGNNKILILLLLCAIIHISHVDSGEGKSLIRKKRYVVFPEGSSFSIALCMTVHTLTSDNIFTEGLNWGISYDLPNESKAALEPFLQLRSDKVKQDKKGYVPSKYNGGWNNNKNYYLPFSKKYNKYNHYYTQRRHRRDLYNKLEVIMNAMGFDGRTCVLRALCEASQRLMPQGNTLIEEMMRISFSLPLKKVFSFEPPEHHTYNAAHVAGRKGQNCVAMFPACSFSLIDLALGNYNALQSDYGDMPEESTGVPRSTEPYNQQYNMK